MGSLQGGTAGALAGALSGAVNGSVLLGGSGGPSLNLSYTKQGGFSGSVGVSLFQAGALKAGASVNFAGGKITGGGLNASVATGEDLWGGKLSLGGGIRFDASGRYAGLDLNAGIEDSHSTDYGGVRFGGNISFERDGGFGGAGVSATYTNGAKDVATTAGLNYRPGAGLSLLLRSDVTYDDKSRAKAGDLAGATASVSNSFGLNSEGKLSATQSIEMKAKFRTVAEAQRLLPGRIAAVEAALNATPNGDADRITELQDELKALLKAEKQANYAATLEADIRARAKELGWGEDKIKAALAGELDEADRIKLRGASATDNNGDSRTWYEKLVSPITDTLAMIFTGQVGDDRGYVDANGNFVLRTCFVAGTLVRVHPETAGAETHNGQSYKRIETIVAGDRVLAWSENSGVLSWRPVQQTFVRKADAIYKLTYADGTVVETTWSHPFYIEGRGWVKAKDLATGDLSYTAGYVRMLARAKMPALSLASYAAPHSASARAPMNDPMAGPDGLANPVVSVEVMSETPAVYNFEVTEDHSYFVTEAEVLVHNADYSATAGYYDQQPLKGYTVNKGPTIETDDGRLYAKLDGPGNRYICEEGCEPPDQILVHTGDGRVIQSITDYDDEGNAYVSSAIYDSKGNILAYDKATDDIAAKAMAIANYDDESRMTLVNGTWFHMGTSESGPNSFCRDPGAMCGTNANEWMKDNAIAGRSLGPDSSYVVPGSSGRIWRVLGDAGAAANVELLEVGGINYGSNTHFYGGAMDIRAIHYNDGTEQLICSNSPACPNVSSGASANTVQFLTALARQQGMSAIYSPWYMQGGFAGGRGPLFPTTTANPLVPNPARAAARMPAGMDPLAWYQATHHLNHLHVYAAPNYCHGTRISSQAECQ